MRSNVQARVTRTETPSPGDTAGPPGDVGPASSIGAQSGRVVSVDRTLAGHALTMVHTIVPERLAELVSLLTRMGTSIDTSVEMAFDELETVHFMRWVVVEGATPREPAQLAFESNHDGTLAQHLNDLYTHGARCMHEVYRCCAGYPLSSSPALSDADFGKAQSFLLQGKIDEEAYYVGRRGKTARRIEVEARLRDGVQAFLDRHGPDPFRRLGGDPELAYDAIVAHLKQAHPADLDALFEAAPPAPVQSVAPIALRALAILPWVLPLLPVLYPLLRYRERTDPVEEHPVLPAEQTRRLAAREDFQVQNQLTHVVALKPGLFRLLTARLVLYAITTLARFHFNQGNLGGLSTIHYARWVLIDGGKRLLFFSNFDGSWERYLGDFIDQAHVGLTAVWSNTQGFPRTSNLINQGATDEERFKAWTRAHQIPTQLWYSAYKHLTVPNVARNSLICAGLTRRPATRAELERWLELL